MITSSPGSIKAINALSMPIRVGSASGKQPPINHASLKAMRNIPTLVRAGGDSDLGLGIQLPPPKRRVRVRNGALEPRSPLRRAVLVAVNLVQRVLGRVEDEGRRIVAKEALAHVDDGLPRRRRRRLVDYRPGRDFAPLIDRSPSPSGMDRRLPPTLRSPDILAPSGHTRRGLELLAESHLRMKAPLHDSERGIDTFGRYAQASREAWEYRSHLQKLHPGTVTASPCPPAWRYIKISRTWP